MADEGSGDGYEGDGGTYYDAISDGYDELHGAEQLKKLEIAKDLLLKHGFIIRPGMKLLDVGCGTGVSSRFPCMVAGIDPSEKLLAKCRANNPDMKTVLGRAEQMQFLDEEFDIVVSLTAVQNFEDIRQGLHEIKRVMKLFGSAAVISYLKKSGKAGSIRVLIEEMFEVVDRVEEEKDIIFLLRS